MIELVTNFKFETPEGRTSPASGAQTSLRSRRDKTRRYYAEQIVRFTRWEARIARLDTMGYILEAWKTRVGTHVYTEALGGHTIGGYDNREHSCGNGDGGVEANGLRCLGSLLK